VSEGTVLVTGGTGDSGGAVVKAMLDAGGGGRDLGRAGGTH
jgi:uncharacterized protein YbjT (DUF2867 family)